MMRITARTLSAAVMILAIGLCSDLASAQQPASTSAQALARQLLELKGATSVYQGSVPGMIDRVKNQLMQNNITKEDCPSKSAPPSGRNSSQSRRYPISSFGTEAYGRSKKGKTSQIATLMNPQIR